MTPSELFERYVRIRATEEQLSFPLLKPGDVLEAGPRPEEDGELDSFLGEKNRLEADDNRTSAEICSTEMPAGGWVPVPGCTNDELRIGLYCRGEWYRLTDKLLNRCYQIHRKDLT